MAKKRLLPDDDFKAEFEKLKQQIFGKQMELNDYRLKEFDLNGAIDYVFNFVRTISEFWKQANYQQRMKVQCLIFPEKLNFDKQEFRTPKLSHIFQSKAAFAGGKHSLVARDGTYIELGAGSSRR